jgi:hypothetical protein
VLLGFVFSVYLQTRSYPKSAFLNADKSFSANASSAGRSAKKRVQVKHTLFAQRPGSTDPAVIKASGETMVGLLKEKIKKKLEIEAPLDCITLQLASADGTLFTAKGSDGKERLVTLSSMDTIDQALEKAATALGDAIKPENKLLIIVDVTPALAFRTTAGLDGTDVHALLASIQRVVPPEYLKRGNALLVPRPLTGGQPQLSGLQLGDVMASGAPLPAGFIEDLKAVRGSSLRAIAAGWTARMRARDNKKRLSHQRNRLINPLVALQSSPGGGKSTVLDAPRCSAPTICGLASVTKKKCATFLPPACPSQ